MVVVFASTGGLTGAEIGIAGGSALLAQRLLEAVFGDDAVRQLTRIAHERLDQRVRGVLAAQELRFTVQLDALGAAGESGDALRRAVARVRAAATAATAIPGTGSDDAAGGRPGHRPGRGRRRPGGRRVPAAAACAAPACGRRAGHAGPGASRRPVHRRVRRGARRRRGTAGTARRSERAGDEVPGTARLVAADHPRTRGMSRRGPDLPGAGRRARRGHRGWAPDACPTPPSTRPPAVVPRARERAALSPDHTVVALAGSTGSGKSSLLNALAGEEVAQRGRHPADDRVRLRGRVAAAPEARRLGRRRPPGRRPPSAATPSTPDGDDAPATCSTGSRSAPGAVPADGATTARVPAALGAAVPTGLVLLDLPDHDSVVVEHRIRAERLVERVDLLVWVVDPQKYADAALHDRYLQPLAGHDDVVVLVLNQVDRLSDSEREACLADLRRLAAEDGLPGVRVLGRLRGDRLRPGCPARAAHRRRPPPAGRDRPPGGRRP